ncbi:thermonuclease family protein [Arthrobacter sp. L77]|uniref:thermonuclease family protein n=1 Tax=Arthrobacter sp. L77 TaxID=1496689 RepID=UPI00068F13D4|nr:thermonuclease family protein [Arthrobacter sp. L77]
MTHARLRRLAPATLLTVAVLASTLTACNSSDPSGESEVDFQPGTVVRVIDGDTLVINFDGDDQTVRLLNVDTPETKHPDKPVECLGPEATEKLESLTPPGTQVGLDFDVERTDKYDRVLAAVFIEDQTLVNAEIARVGLGVPVLIEPNKKYYDEVQAAYNEATAQKVGLMDVAAECTVPAEVADAMEALTAATEAPVGDTASAAAATAAGILAALATAKAVRETLEAGKDTVRVLAIGADRTGELVRDLNIRITRGERSLASANTKATSLEKAEEAAQAAAAKAEAAKAVEAARIEAERIQAEAAEAARVEAERVQAEADARAEADRLAAEAAAIAEQERIRNLPPAPEPYIPPAAPYVPPAPPAAADPYPGYTGPRCYAPGGKTYRPC